MSVLDIYYLLPWSYLAHPRRHGVCAGRAVVRIDDDDSDDDGGDNKDHCEEHVFANERDGTGGGWDQLNYHQ